MISATDEIKLLRAALEGYRAAGKDAMGALIYQDVKLTDRIHKADDAARIALDSGHAAVTDFTPEALAQMMSRVIDKQSRAAEVEDSQMVLTTGRVLNFARTSFRALVDELVGDPSMLLHPWRSVEPADAIGFYRHLAHDLGLDFDAVAAEIGSDFERLRLRQIEQGIIAPARKEPRP